MLTKPGRHKHRIGAQGNVGILSRLFKRDTHNTYVPSMDGALQPNTRLEDSDVLIAACAVTDFCFCDNQLLGARAHALIRMDDGHVVREFDAPIIAVTAKGARIAVAVVDQGIWLFADNHWSLSVYPDAGSITALGWHENDVYLTVGAFKLSAQYWRRDLLEKGSTGSLQMLRHGKFETLVGGLSWPAGLVVLDNGTVIFSEAWQHRVLSFDGKTTPVCVDLPAYPGRLVKTPSGSMMLGCFAPRRPIFEFVLGEDDYRQEMLSRFAPADWIAPSLAPENTLRNSIVQGEIRQMGVMKPWAPTASYGLVVRLDGEFRPVESWHSRADGQRHGITALVVHNGGVAVLSAATGEIISLVEGDPE